MPRSLAGLTLLNFVLVLAVVAALAYLGLSRYFQPLNEDNKQRLLADLNQLHQALEDYRFDNRTYPTTEQGLIALIEKPTQAPIPSFWKQGGYLAALPQDPWGKNYQYVNNLNAVRVYSCGPIGSLEIDLSVLANL